MISLLNGLRILDGTRLIPGAYATSRLADLGADVIKLELPPAGDYLRGVPPLIDELSVLDVQLNRNKRSVRLDLRKAEDAAAFEDLVRSSDVFIESGRPGAADHAGTGYERLRAIRDDIIYCSLSAFGQDGPYSALPAHGAQMEAASGNVILADGTGGRAEAPNLRTFNASQSGGLNAALAILAAVVHRDRTGRGSRLDVSSWASAVSWQYGNLVSLANTGALFPGSEGIGARYGCYQAADGGWVMIGLLERKFWSRFCAEVGRPDLDTDGDGSEITFGTDPQLVDELVQVFSTRNRADWVRLAVEHQLPIAPVLSPAELLEDEHANSQGIFVTTRHPAIDADVRVVALPIKVADQEFEVQRPSPSFGEHTEEVLREHVALP